MNYYINSDFKKLADAFSKGYSSHDNTFVTEQKAAPVENRRYMNNDMDNEFDKHSSIDTEINLKNNDNNIFF